MVANGREDWIGSLDLKMETVNEVATRMTAKVIHEVGADIIGLVEAESRPALVRFHDDLLSLMHGTSYQHIMLIDGNDERGIDVAIMTRSGFDLEGFEATSTTKKMASASSAATARNITSRRLRTIG